MGRVDWQRAALRLGARAGLTTRRTPLLVGALTCTLGVAAAASIWIASAPQTPPSAPRWNLDSAEAALAQGRLVLAQLEAGPPADPSSDVRPAETAPTLAEVIDLPIRRVATTRITLPPEADARDDEDRGEPPRAAPSPDLDALLAQAPSTLFPAPAAAAPVTYASLPKAAVPERFAIRPPRLPLLARLAAPAPLAGGDATWAPASPDPAEPVSAEPDPEATAALPDAPEDPAPLTDALPPPRPDGLPAPAPAPARGPVAAPQVATAPEPEPRGEAREPSRTLGGLLRAVLQGDRMPGVAEAADGATPTACLPEPLRAILADVAREFGTVTLVSTEFLNTGNHYAGSARHRFHRDCEAADFRVDGDVARVVRWLRGRPNVGGVAAYRNGVIHVDLDRAVAARLRRESASR